MKALVMKRIADLSRTPAPLEPAELPDPEPGSGEVLVRVSACGVCHTELDEIEGRTPPPVLPAVLGHEVVGTVAARGPGAGSLQLGERVGIAWIHSACWRCRQCAAGRENLCGEFRGTGRDAPGGYAELVTVREDFAHRIPDELGDVEAAPLLCAGAIGLRSLRLTDVQDGARLGLTGFGASGHLVLALARAMLPRTEVHVFARDEGQRAFALELGATWSGATEDAPPTPLDAIIDTTPAWKPVVAALAALAPGGRLVINAIRKESRDQDELLELDWAEHLWMEKEIKSVANVTRADVRDVLRLCAEHGIVPEVEEVPLGEANRALSAIARGGSRGAKVLRVG